MSVWVMPSVIDVYKNFLKQSQAVAGGRRRWAPPGSGCMEWGFKTGANSTKPANERANAIPSFECFIRMHAPLRTTRPTIRECNNVG